MSGERLQGIWLCNSIPFSIIISFLHVSAMVLIRCFFVLIQGCR